MERVGDGYGFFCGDFKGRQAKILYLHIPNYTLFLGKMEEVFKGKKIGFFAQNVTNCRVDK
jgi:hypothetical protein